MIRLPPDDRAVAIAAGLRASGSSWPQLARRVNRPVGELEQWPNEFPALWTPAIRGALRNVIFDGVAECLHVLRTQLRSTDDKTARDAASWMLRVFMNLNRHRSKGRPGDRPAASTLALANLLESHTDDELDALTRGFDDEPPPEDDLPPPPDGGPPDAGPSPGCPPVPNWFLRRCLTDPTGVPLAHAMVHRELQAFLSSRCSTAAEPGRPWQAEMPWMFPGEGGPTTRRVAQPYTPTDPLPSAVERTMANGAAEHLDRNCFAPPARAAYPRNRAPLPTWRHRRRLPWASTRRGGTSARSSAG